MKMNELGAFLRRRRQDFKAWLEDQGIKTLDDLKAWADENKADFTISHSTLADASTLLKEEPKEELEELKEEAKDENEALRAAKVSLKKILKDLDGTFSVGLGKSSLQVRVGTPGTPTDSIPQEVDGFPVEIVEVATLPKRV